eukprot:TRINITY_DN22927_c0_g1_i1.p1 TRINITY_DN22927_c0_g1~~TRINITY_DN22927_c0_g1_i1.p1  ORF type:complete len:517 (+),score=63.80 TRINITY_DN22927_c0_g1_i1:40-1551(+)
MSADEKNDRKISPSMFQSLPGLQEGASRERQGASRKSRRGISDAISAPNNHEGNHAGRLVALFAEMRKQTTTKNTDEVLNADFQDVTTADRIWYIEGTIPDKWFFLRFGSWLDVFAFQTLRYISLFDTMVVPVMLTFGRVTWLAHLKDMFPVIILIDILIGICYILGTARRLITSTVDLDQAKEFVELETIMRREMRKNTFWFDICSMPGHLWWLDGCRVLCVFRLLRCWRILPNERDRCYQIATGRIENFRSTTIKLTFYLVVVAHYLACGWFYAVMWPFRDMEDLMAVNANYWGSDFLSQYMSTLASGMAMLVGWTGPSASHPDGFTKVELAYNALASPISGVFLAYVVGGLLLALERAAHERDQFLHKMDNIEHVMASLGLPMDTRRRVVKYHTYLNLHHIEKDAYASLFDGLSTHLHKEIQLIMYESLIVSAPFLQQVPVAVLVNIVTAFNNEVFSPGDTIVRKAACWPDPGGYEHEKPRQIFSGRDWQLTVLHRERQL